ncbi:hypothetical protein ONE63_003306 [Megalurothrips usitatus]|uniref:Uncharacterized protein n=1 Tax=Megalurothrips usitatus TaxID=439358 RepID=A0AAV7X9B2_9NEOP|nr:hypothetical protein ONE63_003306 [Megalurothrips usitatus]
MREETEDVEVDVGSGRREVSETSDGLLIRVPADEDGDEDGDGVGACAAMRFGGVLGEEASPSTTTPPPRRCTLKGCWRCCQRRGYNWGLCLWSRCHCYY